MSADSVGNHGSKSTGLSADVTGNSCKFGYVEIVPLTRDTDGPCTTECGSDDRSVEVKQENLPAVKQEPCDVCCDGFMWQQFINICERTIISVSLTINNCIYLIILFFWNTHIQMDVLLFLE